MSKAEDLRRSSSASAASRSAVPVARAMTRPAAALDQAVAIENCMDRALGWNPDIAVKTPE